MANPTHLDRKSGPVPLLLFAVVVSFVLWVVFVVGVPPQETFLGVICALATTAFIFSMWRAERDHLALSVRDILQVRYVPGQVVHDAFRIIGMLFRDVWSGGRAQSLFRVHTFDASPPDPTKLEREVLLVLYMTASPNSILLGVQGDRNLLLMHQLLEEPLPAMARNLGAGGLG